MRFPEAIRYSCDLLSWALGWKKQMPEVPPRLSWFDVHYIMLRHGIGGFLAARLPQEVLQTFPEKVRESMLGAMVQQSRFGMAQAGPLLNALHSLAPEEHPLFLKGPALMFSMYRGFAERSLTDVDLLCHDKDHARKLQHHFMERGLIPKPLEREHHHLSPLEEGDTFFLIELHTNLCTPGLPDHVIQALNERAVSVHAPPLGGFRVLHPEDMLLHLCLHAMNDPIDSLALRNHLEIAWVCKTLGDKAVARVLALADEWQVLVPVKSALMLTQELFGFPDLSLRVRPNPLLFWAHRCLMWPSKKTVRAKVERHLAIKQTHAYWHHGGLGASWVMLSEPVEMVRGQLGKAFRGGGLLPKASVYQRADDMEAVPVGDGLMLHEERTRKVLFLNEPARMLWDACEVPRSKEQLDAWADTPETLEKLLLNDVLRPVKRG